ncbi:hypothetical protein CERZMDRAFT_89841 [Cercospora zeae-maydis SCOH1-5]|uniref:Uncharacterized protein n=1 Tax=Cercospora zeae-maydis SCOH1-5 TaxID=717836 RepID=A0A6A6FRY6_9PEZI|nr:hypothetical protein CERZMDRAFT_89841 [Cercospora zeae-maydis SCOH1-5]
MRRRAPSLAVLPPHHQVALRWMCTIPAAAPAAPAAAAAVAAPLLARMPLHLAAAAPC